MDEKSGVSIEDNKCQSIYSLQLEYAIPYCYSFAKATHDAASYDNVLHVWPQDSVLETNRLQTSPHCDAD